MGGGMGTTLWVVGTDIVNKLLFYGMNTWYEKESVAKYSDYATL